MISFTPAPSKSREEISHQTAILNPSAQLCTVDGMKTFNPRRDDASVT